MILKKLPLEAIFNRHAKNLTPELVSFLNDLMRFFAERDAALAGILNRGIVFNDQFDSMTVTHTFGATPDTAEDVPHDLGRAPVSFIVLDRDLGGVVYRAGAGDETKLQLACTVANMTATILVL